ncbi:MAG: terminase large subunit domain-containing protein [Acidiferrobacterales bacterium]
MTKASIHNEIVTCGKNPNYFIKKYVRIRHPKRGLIPFEMFDYQENLVDSYIENRFNIVLKARQLGVSEVTAAYALWLMLFHRQKNIIVMASKAETAKNIIKKVQTAFANLPKWLLLADSKTDNVLSLELTNGSSIKSIATSGDAGRSEAISLLILDEAAFIPNFDTLWTGLYPTVSAGGNIVVLSTPNGVGNKFHQLYVDAEEGENDFMYHRLMWWVHPEHIDELEEDPDRPGFKTSPWFRKEIKASKMGPREVAQELECNFNASGDTVIPGDRIEEMNQGVIDPSKREWWDRNMFVYWDPQPNHRYVVGADVARGDGKDYSSAEVFDIDTMEQVAEYYGKIPPDDFAKVLITMGKNYNKALLVVENNTIGLAALEHVRLLGYDNVYYSRKGDSKPGEAVNTLWGPSEGDLIIGFTTSPKTRPLIVAKLEEYIRNHLVIFRSKRFMEELKTFIWDNGRPQAMRGYNDDAVMASAIACWIKDTFISPNAVSAEVQAQLLKGIKTDVRKNTEILGASKNPEFVKQATMGIFTSANPRDQFRIRLPNGKVADFDWLIDSPVRQKR